MPKKKPSSRQTLEAMYGPIPDEEWRRICAVPTARVREILAATAPARRRSSTGRQRPEKIQFAALDLPGIQYAVRDL